MKFCRSALGVLLLSLLSAHSVVSEVPSATVKVYLNDSAILPCSSGSCSGFVSWVKPQNSSNVVAWCDQNRCFPQEEFLMSHAEYLQGNFSLNITAVDHGDAGSYRCQCENIPIQDVLLQLKAAPAVKVKLHDSAVLPCSKRCPGLVRWTVSDKPTDTLAECDQTSCRSVEEGYQMIHDQYLKGNISLIITGADFSKRALYICECDGTDLCDVRLQIEALNSTVQVKPGESLVLDLEGSDPVKVVYNSTGAANQSGDQICTVDGRTPQCGAGYSQRTSSALKLRGMNVSDSGVYTVRDSRNEEVIHIYTVIVRDEQNPDHGKGDAVWTYLYASLAVSVVLGLAVIVLLVVKSMKVHRPCGNQECIPMNPVAGNGDADQGAEKEAILPPDLQ